jgi:putative inorganic carbon (hco3(-)) transporter
VIISGSRGGFVGLIALYLCILYFSPQKKMVLGLGVVALILFPMLTSEGYMGYMKTILGLFTGSADISGSSRTTGLRHGFEMLIRRPLLGVGPGCYPLARSSWFGWGLWAHNHYGELMGDLGVIGTVVWGKFFWSYFKKALQILKENKDNTVQAICLSVIVANIVRLVLGMGSHSVYIFFWYMTAAVIAALDRIAVNEKVVSK